MQFLFQESTIRADGGVAMGGIDFIRRLFTPVREGFISDWLEHLEVKITFLLRKTEIIYRSHLLIIIIWYGFLLASNDIN